MLTIDTSAGREVGMVQFKCKPSSNTCIGQDFQNHFMSLCFKTQKRSQYEFAASTSLAETRAVTACLNNLGLSQLGFEHPTTAWLANALTRCTTVAAATLFIRLTCVCLSCTFGHTNAFLFRILLDA